MTSVGPPPSGSPLPPPDPATLVTPRPPLPPPAARSRSLLLPVVAALAAAAVVGAVVGGLVAGRERPVLLSPEPAAAPAVIASGSIAAVARAIAPTVVSVTAPGSSDGEGGTGLVVRSDGYIVTNEHVLSAASTARVTFADGTEETATVVGRSTDYDLAVLAVKRTGLPAAVLADSASVLVGDTAIALGSPLGLSGTVTAGIISAVNRPVVAGREDAVISAIQTDAPINPGSSGGPLVNARAEVIGINSANAGLTGTDTGSIGLGFAIPSNQARRIIDELIATRRSSVPVIGIGLDGDYTGVGARVKSVDARGPSQAAGLTAGDVITSVDGHLVPDRLALVAAIRAAVPGQQVILHVSGDAGERDVSVTLGAKTG